MALLIILMANLATIVSSHVITQGSLVQRSAFPAVVPFSAAAPVTVGFAKYVPQNILPFASQVSFENRALSGYVSSPLLAAYCATPSLYASGFTYPGLPLVRNGLSPLPISPLGIPAARTPVGTAAIPAFAPAGISPVPGVLSSAPGVAGLSPGVFSSGPRIIGSVPGAVPTLNSGERIPTNESPLFTINTASPAESPEVIQNPNFVGNTPIGVNPNFFNNPPTVNTANTPEIVENGFEPEISTPQTQGPEVVRNVPQIPQTNFNNPELFIPNNFNPNPFNVNQGPGIQQTPQNSGIPQNTFFVNSNPLNPNQGPEIQDNPQNNGFPQNTFFVNSNPLNPNQGPGIQQIPQSNGFPQNPFFVNNNPNQEPGVKQTPQNNGIPQNTFFVNSNPLNPNQGPGTQQIPQSNGFPQTPFFINSNQNPEIFEPQNPINNPLPTQSPRFPEINSINPNRFPDQIPFNEFPLPQTPEVTPANPNFEGQNPEIIENGEFDTGSVTQSEGPNYFTPDTRFVNPSFDQSNIFSLRGRPTFGGSNGVIPLPQEKTTNGVRNFNQGRINPTQVPVEGPY